MLFGSLSLCPCSVYSIFCCECVPWFTIPFLLVPFIRLDEGDCCLMFDFASVHLSFCPFYKFLRWYVVLLWLVFYKVRSCIWFISWIEGCSDLWFLLPGLPALIAILYCSWYLWFIEHRVLVRTFHLVDEGVFSLLLDSACDHFVHGVSSCSFAWFACLDCDSLLFMKSSFYWILRASFVLRFSFHTCLLGSMNVFEWYWFGTRILRETWRSVVK
jgi:hypothetical protein